MNILKRVFKKKPLPLERKVYEDWAMSGYEKEKREINEDIYKEIMKEIRLYKSCYPIPDETIEELNEFDIVVGNTGELNHSASVYKVYKNTTNLSNDKLALLCDNGNLCFGYVTKQTEDNHLLIKVFEN